MPTSTKRISHDSTLLTRRELEIITRSDLHYPLAVAEKDYVLAIVSRIIFHSSLKSKLIFKGGTALHHCYLPQLRFSEDLDFTSTDKAITVKEVRNVLVPYDFLTVQKEFSSTSSVKLERIQYRGPLGFPNFFKLEIDRLQNVILPPKEMTYNNAWNIKTKVRVMDITEICAEKIRAMSDRARYRDFYDFFMIRQHYPIKIEKIIDLVKRKEIRRQIRKSSILQHWDLVHPLAEREAQTIYFSKAPPKKEITALIKQLPFASIG